MLVKDMLKVSKDFEIQYKNIFIHNRLIHEPICRKFHNLYHQVKKLNAKSYCNRIKATVNADL